MAGTSEEVIAKYGTADCRSISLGGRWPADSIDWDCYGDKVLSANLEGGLARVTSGLTNMVDCGPHKL